MSRMGSEKAGRRPRRRFTEEFKAGAIRWVVEEDKTVGAVARELDDPAATALATTASATRPQKADIGERQANASSDRAARLWPETSKGRVDDRGSDGELTRTSGAVVLIADVSSGPTRR